VLFSSAATVARVPLFLLALLTVRALPAVLYRSAPASIREVATVGLLQATSLPFIVAATTIGLALHAIRPANAAALVAARLFSVIIFTSISLQLLRSSAKGPSTAPEQPHGHWQPAAVLRMTVATADNVRETERHNRNSVRRSWKRPETAE
jgi:hypothetical protein